MAANVEIKARLADPQRVRPLVESLSEFPVEVLHQEDIFFRVPVGRLKLRTLGEGRGELIYYSRPELPEPKVSEYTLAPTADPAALRRILAALLEVEGVVRKERLVCRLGQVRVHLDRVEGLGEFLELEVVLRPEQPVAEGVRLAREIMERLGIGDDQLVEAAYLDLLRAERGGRAP